MRCQDFQSHMVERGNVPAEPVLLENMAEHLANCPECRDLRRLWDALSSPTQTEPPAGMSSRFRERLAVELITRTGPKPLLGTWWLPLSVAAALLLAVGATLGYGFRPGREGASSPLASLQRGTAADRMEAIALVNSRGSEQAGVVSALMDRIDRDPSLEVRLSAVEALYLFGGDSTLSRRIEATLHTQTRPEVQLALIDLLGALRQKRAADALRRLLAEDRLPHEARLRAAQRLAQMNL